MCAFWHVCTAPDLKTALASSPPQMPQPSAHGWAHLKYGSTPYLPNSLPVAIKDKGECERLSQAVKGPQTAVTVRAVLHGKVLEHATVLSACDQRIIAGKQAAHVRLCTQARMTVYCHSTVKASTRYEPSG